MLFSSLKIITAVSLSFLTNTLSGAGILSHRTCLWLLVDVKGIIMLVEQTYQGFVGQAPLI
jgi:hypothetical protein